MKGNGKYRVLVVDDEKDICRALEFLLSREGYEVDTAQSGEAALRRVSKDDYDLVLTDLKMEGMDGIQLIERIKEVSPSTVLVLMTAYASVENAVDAMKKGAGDYIVKPFVNEDVKLTISRLLEHRKLSIENLALRRQLSDRLASNMFIGDSPRIREIFDTLEKVIPTMSNILLLGESGTGKGMVAEIIHMNSPRKDRPFMSINCSAIPDTLLESELFGYRKGAFTGAGSDKPGLIVTADGGTLFLDEIGDMPVGLQSKLLKVIETGEVLPLGDVRHRVVDIRFISATNRNIEESVKRGEFREDLYYRLDVIQVTIPPLRERREDIPLLVQHFVDKFRNKYNKVVNGVSVEAMKLMVEFNWYGNARELSNVIERAVVLCGSDTITADELPDKLKEKHLTASGASLKDSLNYFEKKLILDTLVQHNWNKDDAARGLGIDLATLYRKMKKLGIETGGKGD
jgi:DNA-binding NtrC family response regulator